MMTFDLSENLAVWIGNSTKHLAAAFATEGIGLPAAVAYSAKEYYTDVRNVTPPANGGTVASVALNRGKAKITIDLRKSFRVVQKVAGIRTASPLAFYLSQRWKRGGSKIKFDVSLSEFRDVEKELQRRVGYMQSGWNHALNRFGAKIPSWVSGKNGAGSVFVAKTAAKMIVKAENKVAGIRGIRDMQRRIDYVSRKHKQRLERASAMQAKTILGGIFE